MTSSKELPHLVCKIREHIENKSNDFISKQRGSQVNTFQNTIYFDSINKLKRVLPVQVSLLITL